MILIKVKGVSKYAISICHRAVSYLPNIFKCLEADVLGGEAFSEKRVHAYFTLFHHCLAT